MFLLALKMIKRLSKLLFLSLVMTATMVSCHTREVAYISDAQRDSAQEILETYTATILPGDILYIHVASLTPESVIPFNQETHRYNTEVSRMERGVQSTGVNKVSTEVSGYTVSDNGTIIFPILGSINVLGFTQDRLCRYLEKRLRNEGYVNDPQVTTKLMNFRVTVVGEVRAPQQIHVNGTRLTIFEALAVCGDMTEQGMRTNVTVVRQEGEEREIGEIDLTSAKMFDSPYYYLHNNDIVYVEPTKKKKALSDRNTEWPTYVSTIISISNLIRNIANTYRNIQRMNN